MTNAAGSYLTAAMVLLVRGQPADAEPLLRRAAAASREPLPSIAIMIGQTMVDVALGRAHSAQHSARAARSTVDRLADPPDFVLRWVGLAEAEADLAVGDPGAVTAKFHSAVTSAQPAGDWTERERVRLSRALMELGGLPEADRLLRETPADSENPLTGVEIWLTEALIADRLRQDDRAVRAICRAMGRAAPERICLPFLTFDRARSPLTDRELGVLRLLPGMLSNTEIADELFISVNTVKVHLKSLYRKLDVPNRRGAVRRGHSLRLIG